LVAAVASYFNIRLSSGGVLTYGMARADGLGGEVLCIVA
jgi:ribosomal protein S8